MADTQSKNALISVIVPVLNEENNILVLYQGIKKNLKNFKYEIIFVNDGSYDRSQETIEKIIDTDRNVKLINLSRNFGHQIAISC